MTVIYLTEYNTICYVVIFQVYGCIKVQKIKIFSDSENDILKIKPLKAFLGKSQVCDVTCVLGAFDKSVFNRNTILLKLSEENDRHRRYLIEIQPY